MKYWIAFGLGVLCWLVLAESRAEWDTTDKVLGAAAVTALVMDWGQTRYIAKHPDQYWDHNPLLGHHPSLGRVNGYFIGAIAGTIIVADWLKPDNRKLFLGIMTGFEVGIAHRNKSLGIKIAF